MDRKDVEKVIENLQNKPFICGENEIEVAGSYVILKKEEYEKLRKKANYDAGKAVEQIRTTGICGRCLNRQSSIEICATFCDIGKKLEIIKAGGVNAT